MSSSVRETNFASISPSEIICFSSCFDSSALLIRAGGAFGWRSRVASSIDPKPSQLTSSPLRWPATPAPPAATCAVRWAAGGPASASATAAPSSSAPPRRFHPRPIHPSPPHSHQPPPPLRFEQAPQPVPALCRRRSWPASCSSWSGPGSGCRATSAATSPSPWSASDAQLRKAAPSRTSVSLASCWRTCSGRRWGCCRTARTTRCGWRSGRRRTSAAGRGRRGWSSPTDRWSSPSTSASICRSGPLWIRLLTAARRSPLAAGPGDTRPTAAAAATDGARQSPTRRLASGSAGVDSPHLYAMASGAVRGQAGGVRVRTGWPDRPARRTRHCPPPADRRRRLSSGGSTSEEALGIQAGVVDV